MYYICTPTGCSVARYRASMGCSAAYN